MPKIKALNRLPFQTAVSALKRGEGSSQLPSVVKGIKMKFVARNSPSGPREFIKTYAPRIAYANPSISMSFERIPDPRSKSKDPKDKNKSADISLWENGQPEPELFVEYFDFPARTIKLGKMSGNEIFNRLREVSAGQGVSPSLTDPAEPPLPTS
ncbi:hypothetical protein M231_02498 [Tremella mesenterica]|uniref:Ribosomal protein/NADH dehydrogenase domain-containing protein n=1 Tax=Tremella mesenterica TaxID=5217 RepID=A0A4Q1BQK8_TREME|nr:uncharacterized protein TREMEDRAFT_74562 [Tremella mesenterica DSM 1558]EIW67360.1 hypothetical protein TREMEDRAFT_74562 [Tremella mesenterica DSM 1558]RXK40224.1 hypothetical protein M231_02498 [Tremella mesenterica]